VIRSQPSQLYRESQRWRFLWRVWWHGVRTQSRDVWSLPHHVRTKWVPP
jgi:hypothetical protein